MTKPITKEKLEWLKSLSEDKFNSNLVVVRREELQALVATIYQERDALRVALDYVDGKKDSKGKQSAILTRAILREALGLKNEEDNGVE